MANRKGTVVPMLDSDLREAIDELSVLRENKKALEAREKMIKEKLSALNKGTYYTYNTKLTVGYGTSSTINRNLLMEKIDKQVVEDCTKTTRYKMYRPEEISDTEYETLQQRGIK